MPLALKGVNIHTKAVHKALDTMAERMIGLSEGLFPWANKVVVRKQWVYDWTDFSEEIGLPPTETNTPK